MPRTRRRKRSPFNILLGTRFLVWGIAAILLALSAIMIVQGFIDTAKLREEIISTLKEKTGQEVKIKGTVTVRLLPRPVAFVAGLEITKNNNDKIVPELSANLVVLNLDAFTLLDDKPKITGIAMQNPVLVIQRAADHYMQWGWINSGLIKSLFSKDSGTAADFIKVVDGKMIFRENSADSEELFSINDIYVKGKAGNAPYFEGEASMNGHMVQFAVDSNSGDIKVPAGAIPLNMSLFTDSKNKAQVKGYLDVNSEVPKIEGAFKMESDNLRNWVKTADQQANDQPAPKGQIEAPFVFSGHWSQTGDSVEVVDAELQALNSAGSGSVSLTWSEWHPNFQVDMHMKAFDYNKWDEVFHDVILEKLQDSKPKQGSTYSYDDQPRNPLPQDLHMLVYLDIENLILGAQTLRQTQIQAALADGALTVNQFNIQMPGDAALTLFGVVSPANTGGLRFEGSMEMQGKSLRKMLTLVDETATELPEVSFGEFGVRSNVFISSEQVRLSEAQAKLNDLQLSGGLVGYFDEVPRIEADVRLKDINFDYFRDVWRDTHKTPGNGDYFLKFDRGTNYNWLKKLKSSVDFRVVVDGFTFLENQGSTASFRLFAREGELGLYNMRMTYPTSELDANLTVNVRGDVPAFSVVLNTDQLNTNYFLPFEEKKEEEEKPEDAGPKKRVWSEDLVDMGWLDGYAASLDLTINKLMHHDITIDGLKFQGKLENSALVFKNTSFSYWDGKCSLSGLLYGGKVPGLNASFTLYNAQLRDMLKSLTGHDNISGRMSLTGTMSTTGVNYLSWISQAEANMSISGRSVTVDGMNLRGVVEAVKVSRTAADVFNNANLSLRKGATDFSVDGSLNVKNASVKSPGITLKSGVASGMLNGEIKLVPWKLDSSVLFNFQAFGTENAPTMTIQVSGPLEDPQMRSDTSSLEAYVAKQIIGH